MNGVGIHESDKFYTTHSKERSQLSSYFFLISVLMEMVGESVVSFVVERSLGLLLEEVKFLDGVSDQVEEIRAELRWMNSFLIDADRIQDESAMLHTKVEEVRDLSLKTEDIVESFILKVASRRRGGSFLSILQRYACILTECIERHKVGLELQGIKNRITEITRRLQTYEQREGSSSASQRKFPIMRRTYSHTDEEEFVGMQKNVEELVTQLVDERKNCRVVSISGMGGIGKTTLARKVYKDIRVQRHFDGCAWACISEQFQQQQTKDVLCGILSRLTGEKSEDLKKKNDDELVKCLFDVQKNKKCLVVLDDIWLSDAWDCLKHAFPIKETGSKILLTTRNINVAESVDPQGFHHKQRYLTDDESWELLQKKTFTKGLQSDPGEEKSMERLGKKMVGHCGGLPLAVVVLGGLLGTKHTLREWEMVDQNINFYLNRGNKIGQQHGSVPQVLALSYSDLPYHLKPCFLCLGNFPEDSDIEVDKLYKVWMAEGMVLADDKADKETLTDVAERYLGELAARFMVELQIDHEHLTGRIFSCRLHDLMRELCLSKGKEENFLKFIDIIRSDGVKEDIVDSSSSSSASSSISKVWRLSVYLDVNVKGFVPPKQGTSTHHLRSLMFFTPEDGEAKYIPKVIKSYFRDFKFLRVLILESFGDYFIDDSLSLPNGIGSLIHLRYLSVRGSYFTKFPSSLGNLAYLQTLDLRVDENVPCFPNVLWKMRRLMHLYLPERVAETLTNKLKLDGLSNLETLENFDPYVCRAKDLFKLTNLRKLKLIINSKWKLEELEIIIKYLNDDVTSSNRLLRHSCVHINCGEEQLGPEKWVAASTQLLVCHHLHELHLYNRIDKLPRIFSPSITELSLWFTMLDEDPMETLEKLPLLLILSLKYQSFMRKEMVCSTMGFPRLKSLTLYNLSNLENWRVDEGAMPCLTHLTIDWCKNLKMVPDGLRFVTTLKELELKGMPEAFIDRVGVLQEKDGKEGEDFDKVRHVPYVTFTRSSGHLGDEF